MMNKKMLTTVLSLSLVMPLAQANEFAGMEGFEQPEKPLSIEEASGLGLGAIVGGLLAGPAGAFVGGAGGGLIARDGLHRDENARLQAELDAATSKLASLQIQHDKLAAVYNKSLLQQTRIVESKRSTPAITNLATGLAMTVQFRHDSASLEKHFVEQLEQLARSFAGMKQLHIHLSGHADRTGGDSYNDSLSRSRVESVARVLGDAGWPATRLHMRARGEHEPVSQHDDLQGYSFDRRVILTFSAGGTGA